MGRPPALYRTLFPGHSYLLSVDMRPGREIPIWSARECGNLDGGMPGTPVEPSLFNPQQKSCNEDQSQEGNDATHGRANFALPPRPGQRDANFPTDPRLGLGDSQETFPGKTTFIHGDCLFIELA